MLGLCCLTPLECGSVRAMLFNATRVRVLFSVVVLGLCCLTPLECGSVRVMLFNTTRVW